MFKLGKIQGKSSMYKIQEKGRPETAVWLINNLTTISNEKDADIPFYGSSSGTTKVQLSLQGQDLYLQDVSANTTILHNNQRINHSVQLQHGDAIKIADTNYQILNSQHHHSSINASSRYNDITKDPKHWQLQAIEGDITGRAFKLGPQTVIGREPDCNICIPNEQLSRKHVQLIVTGGKVMLQDLNSTNGTYVNGKPVEHRILDENDEIRVGRITFKLIAPAVAASSNINSNEDKTVMATVVPNVKVELPKSTDQKFNTTQKSWVTKPTSVGNREADTIDVLLERHLHIKKVTARLFILAIIGLTVLGYVLTQ